MEPEPSISRRRRLERHRLYFAFRPDDAAREATMEILSGAQDRHGARGTPIKRENLHVSLFPLWGGDALPADLIEVASVKVQAIESKPFMFNFDLLASFRRRNGYCTVLASSHDPFELYNLQRHFVRRFEGLVRAGSLTPHMTLLYSDTFIEKQAIPPVRWQAREFLLIHSVVGEARQEILGRWPLR